MKPAHEAATGVATREDGEQPGRNAHGKERGIWQFTHSDNAAIYPVGRRVTIVRAAGREEFDLHWLTQSSHPSALVNVPYDPATQRLQGSGICGTGPDGRAYYTVSIGPFDPSDPGKHPKISGTVTDATPTSADSGGLAGLWGADAKPPVEGEHG